MVALLDRSAQVVRISDHRPRFHVRLESREGPLFAWYSLDPGDRAVLDREVAVRALIGEGGVLRTPPLLEHGETWRLERMVQPDPLAGRSVIQAVVDAWAQITRLPLPVRAEGRPRRRILPTLGRRARLVQSPLPMRDIVAARRALAESKLPIVLSHGDFHAAHVLPARGGVYVIDWELAGPRPQGFDLMQLWASLPGQEEREFLFDAAVDLLGPQAGRGLVGLRYVALVQRIASKLAEQRQYGSRDREEARALLALLPDVRAQARA